MKLNKKEKKLVEMFEESTEIALKYSEGSVWSFLGSLMMSLAMEAQPKGDFIMRKDRADELVEILKRITDKVH